MSYPDDPTRRIPDPTQSYPSGGGEPYPTGAQYPPADPYAQQGYPPAPPPNRTPQILAAVAAVIALVAAGVLAYLFLSDRDSADPEPAPTAAPVTTVVTEAPQAGDAPGARPTTTTTVTTHVPATPATPTAAVTVPGADAQGFLGGPRCNAAEDPAVFIGQTPRSRVVVCQVGQQTGRYYYKGLAGGNAIEVGYPTRSGSTFTAVNGATTYTVSPSSLVISEGGGVIANEPMLASWVN